MPRKWVGIVIFVLNIPIIRAVAIYILQRPPHLGWWIWLLILPAFMIDLYFAFKWLDEIEKGENSDC